jgi:hypothetical protein
VSWWFNFLADLFLRRVEDYCVDAPSIRDQLRLPRDGDDVASQLPHTCVLAFDFDFAGSSVRDSFHVCKFGFGDDRNHLHCFRAADLAQKA